MLRDLAARPIHVGIRPAKLFLGKGSLGLEVVEVGLGEGKQPSKTDLRALFRGRQKRRAAPVMIVVPWGNGRAGVCGPTEHNRVELEDVPMAAIEAVCRKALAADGRHVAIRLLRGRLSQLASKVPGLRNGGLFAMQELERGLPRRGDWASARAKAEGLRALRMRALMRGLGHEIEELPGQGMLLLSGARRTAVAVFVERLGKLDSASEGFGGVSPISYALAQADRSNLDWVVAGADSAIRLYPAKPGVGTGRRGRAETFVELDLELLSADRIGCLWLFFSKDALIPGGSVEQILKASEDYAVDLGGRLRERVYREAMPMLARQVAAAMRLEESSGFGAEGLVLAYQASLRILFRILFVAYAEDRGLLPLRTSRSYREHSLKRIAQRLEEARRKGVAFGEQDSLWTEVDQIWKAVSSGHPEWGVPAYNGELFARDASVSELGARIAMVRLSDRGFAPVLSALLLDETPEGTRGPVDFRSLGVREFGTIYEGLLESELSIADTDLKVGASGAYLPAKKGDEVVARAGQTYLHNRSGARKSTGSYYTPAFAVDHLLDRALEPAIEAHLDRLDEMSDREAGRRFFEFRVADIAMGSGHFLVGAVDRIERGLSNYLSKRPLPDVREEFGRLRKTAEERLGLDRAESVIEDVRLLRRQVARRCVFGVDINPTAVDLARLSLWIHTFVPGLPLSLLDENLIQGNSLVGIASLDEASELFRAGSGELFSQVARDRLEQLAGPLERLGRLAEATNAEINEARDLHDETRRSVKGVADLFTLLSASRTNAEIRTAIAEGRLALSPKGDPVDERLLRAAREEFAGLDALHFPLVFPQVLCFGERRGFDVILGNPPWEKVKVEEQGFWARHFPGLRSLPQRVRERTKERYREERPDLVARLEAEIETSNSLRRVLTSSAFPGMGTGDPDLHKAFSWRFLGLAARGGGKIGVVIPRSAMSAKGSTKFRKRLLANSKHLDVTVLMNRKLWAFPQVHPQYTACLVVADLPSVSHRRGCKLRLSGPYASLDAFTKGTKQAPMAFSANEVQGWTDTASLPLLPSDASLEVFVQLRKSPRLDLDDGSSWRARPHRELDATHDKPLMNFASSERPKDHWPVYKGASFNLWEPDTGTYYAWADPERVRRRLQAKRIRANKRSAFSEFDAAWRKDPETLPCLLGPRIAFRDITNRTNSRTVIAALVPPRIFLANQAPYLLWLRGGAHEEAYLLGVLSSLPFDWYARCFVELHLNFYVINPFPIPRPGSESKLRQRVVELAGRLASPDDRFADWAERLGVACGPLDPDQKQDHIEELDAVIAHLYGLSEAQLRHVFETFHRGWDYEERLRGTLVHFASWRSAQ